ncbi:MAG: hypothetical protein ACT4OK_11035 [Gemmobacter sp.]
MGISTEGDWGTGSHATSATSFTFTTSTTALSSLMSAMLIVVTDNVSTSSGETNLHTSITGGTGSWTKVAEYTNGEGAAGAGVTTSLWIFDASGSVPTGTTITINLAEAVVDKCCSGHVFARDSDKKLRIVAGSSPQFSEVDAATGFGSSTISGLTSKQYLFIRALGKEANSTGNITPTSSYGTFGAQRSRNDASAVLVRGERRVVTTTSQTSNPSMSVTGDTAGIFVAIEEYVPTGNPVGTGSVSLGFSLTGNGTGKVKGVGAVGLGVTLGGTGRAKVRGSGAVDVSFTASGVGGEVLPDVLGTGNVSFGWSLSGSGRAKARGAGTGGLALSVQSTGKARIKGQGAALLDFVAAGLGSVRSPPGTGIGAAVLEWFLTANGRAPAKGTGAVGISFALSGGNAGEEPETDLGPDVVGVWAQRMRIGCFIERNTTGTWKKRERMGRWL